MEQDGMEESPTSGSGDSQRSLASRIEEDRDNTMPASYDSPDRAEVPTPNRNASSCRAMTIRCLLFPLALLGTVLLTLILFFFGVIPLIMVGFLLLTFYYCCSREPIPIRVLLRALFAEDDETAAAPWTKQDIEYSLHRRICGGKWKGSPKAHRDISEHPLHKGEVLWKEGSETYLFSQLLKKSSDSSYFRENASRYLPTNDAPAGNEINEETKEGLDRLERGEEKNQVDGEIPQGTASADNGDIQTKPNEQEVQSMACCDICLLEYTRGDVVAWSKNQKCLHAFHSDCLVDWIQRKPTCPSCRQEYKICKARSSPG